MFGDYTDLKHEYEDQGKFIGNWFKDKPVKSLQPYMLFQAGMFEGLSINDPHLFQEFISLIPDTID